MKNKVTLVCTIILSCTSLLASTRVQRGDVVFASNFKSEHDRAIWLKSNHARWVNEGMRGDTCLLIQDAGAAHTSIHLAPYRGMRLLCSCIARAERVTKPSKPYLGIKYVLHYKSSVGERWKQLDNVYGTFTWKKISFELGIPNDVTDADLILALQDCSGKVWFDSISVTVENNPPLPSVDQKNISLQQLPRFRGVMSPTVFKEDDIQTLGTEWKANLIRWHFYVSSKNLNSIDSNLDNYDQWIDEKLTDLDSVITACKKYGIKVVIDLHFLPGGRDSTNAQIAFYQKSFNDHFVEIWKSIARRYQGNVSIWGYDLMNEPVQTLLSPQGMDFLSSQMKAAKAIRAIDKRTPIIIEVDEWDSSLGFIGFSPVPISNVIYSVHMYDPHTYTHQGVFSDTNGIAYPGTIDGIYYDENTLKQLLQPVRDFQLAYHAHIYVGEFSAIRWAPGAAHYISDCIEIFEEYGWDWTYHSYREWNGWDTEYENGVSKKSPPQKALQDTDRKIILLKWFAKNRVFESKHTRK